MYELITVLFAALGPILVLAGILFFVLGFSNFVKIECQAARHELAKGSVLGTMGHPAYAETK